MKKIFTVSTLSLLICSGCVSSPNYIQKPPKDESYVPRNHNSQSNRITSIAKDNHRRDPRHNEVVNYNNNYNTNHSSSYSSSQSSSSSSSTGASGNSSSYSYSYSDGNGSSSYSYSYSSSNNNNNYNDNYNNDYYYDCDGNDNDSYYDYGDNNYGGYNEDNSDNYYEDTYETNCNNAPNSNQTSTSGTSNLGHIPSNTTVNSASVANLLTHQAANNNESANTDNSSSTSNEQTASNNSNEQYANDDDSSEQYANDDNSNEQSTNNDSNGSIGTSSTGLNRNAILLEHNKARQEVGIGNLTWSSELEQVAQNYAEVIANKCSLVHSNNKKYGENLFMGTKGYYTASDGVKSWVDEKKDYDYDTNTGYGKVVGHYTQVVWKNTTQVGCGQAIGCGNMWLVCNYNPPGNYNNQRPY